MIVLLIKLWLLKLFFCNVKNFLLGCKLWVFVFMFVINVFFGVWKFVSVVVVNILVSWNKVM